MANLKILWLIITAESEEETGTGVLGYMSAQHLKVEDNWLLISEGPAIWEQSSIPSVPCFLYIHAKSTNRIGWRQNISDPPQDHPLIPGGSKC